MNKPVPRSILGIKEKRSYVRTAMPLGAVLQYQEERYEGTIRNISPRGFFILCSHRFPLHQFLQVHCHLHLAEKLDCMVEVVHARETGIGARIVSIDSRNRQSLLQFVHDLQEAERNDGRANPPV